MCIFVIFHSLDRMETITIIVSVSNDSILILSQVIERRSARFISETASTKNCKVLFNWQIWIFTVMLSRLTQASSNFTRCRSKLNLHRFLHPALNLWTFCCRFQIIKLSHVHFWLRRDVIICELSIILRWDAPTQVSIYQPSCNNTRKYFRTLFIHCLVVWGMGWRNTNILVNMELKITVFMSLAEEYFIVYKCWLTIWQYEWRWLQCWSVISHSQSFTVSGSNIWWSSLLLFLTKSRCKPGINWSEAPLPAHWSLVISAIMCPQ